MISPKTRRSSRSTSTGSPSRSTQFQAIAKRHGVRLIEDRAQCHGARFGGRRLGSIGDIACFSSYPTKNLGAIGDGGAIVTSDPELAQRCKLIREYGWAERYVSHIAGQNSRLDELQAAVLRVKLAALDTDNQQRADIAARYDRALGSSGLVLPKRRPNTSHVFHLYVVRSAKRDALIESLKQAEIGALIHYRAGAPPEGLPRAASAAENRYPRPNAPRSKCCLCPCTPSSRTTRSIAS